MTEPALKRTYGGVPPPRQAFAAHLRATRAEGTCRLYAAVLTRWLAHLDACACPWDALDRSAVNLWMKHRRAAGVKPATLGSELSAIRAFYTFALAFGFLAPARDPAGLFPVLRRVPRRLPRVLDAAQIAALLGSLREDTPLALRDAALVRTLLETGITAAEAARLTLGDVLGDGFLHVVGVPRRPARLVPASPALLALLGRWMAAREPLARRRRRQNAVLFLGARGQPLAVRSISTLVGDRVRAALALADGYRVLQRSARRRPWSELAAHALRDTAASRWLQATQDIRLTQAALGLATPQAVLRYEAVDLERLKREHAKLYAADEPAPAARPRRRRQQD